MCGQRTLRSIRIRSISLFSCTSREIATWTWQTFTKNTEKNGNFMFFPPSSKAHAKLLWVWWESGRFSTWKTQNIGHVCNNSVVSIVQSRGGKTPYRTRLQFGEQSLLVFWLHRPLYTAWHIYSMTTELGWGSQALAWQVNLSTSSDVCMTNK